MMMEYIFSEPQQLIRDRLIDRFNNKEGSIMLLHGPPGSGKTSFVFAMSKLLNLPVYFVSGDVAEESPYRLFYEYNITAMNAGTGSYSPTELWTGVQDSQTFPVIILVDEYDKSHRTTDSKLLQLFDTDYNFFMNPYNEKVMGDIRNMYVFLTTNAQRSFNTAFNRRAQHVYFPAHNYDRFKSVLISKGFEGPAVDLTTRLCIGLREHIKDDNHWPTPSEAVRFLKDLDFCGDTNVPARQYQEILYANFSKGLHREMWDVLIEQYVKQTFGGSKTTALAKAFHTVLSKATVY